MKYFTAIPARHAKAKPGAAASSGQRSRGPPSCALRARARWAGGRSGCGRSGRAACCGPCSRRWPTYNPARAGRPAVVNSPRQATTHPREADDVASEAERAGGAGRRRAARGVRAVGRGCHRRRGRGGRPGRAADPRGARAEHRRQPAADRARARPRDRRHRQHQPALALRGRDRQARRHGHRPRASCSPRACSRIRRRSSSCSARPTPGSRTW